jgi:hypothetical protein
MSLGGGVGYFQGNVGDGVFAGQGGPSNHGVNGMRFGNSEGFDRFQAGADWRLDQGDRSLIFGAFGGYGTKTVPEGAPQQGKYELMMVGGTAALHLGF